MVYVVAAAGNDGGSEDDEEYKLHLPMSTKQYRLYAIDEAGEI